MTDTERVTRSNEQAWDIASGTYVAEVERDVELLKSRGSALMPIEQEILGDLTQCATAIHLQCSHGLDVLSLLNHGVREVVGVDISGAMLALAAEKSRRLHARARWIHANVLDLPHELSGSADLVYTRKGALFWVMDLDRWAGRIARLLRPGGRLFVFEAHPLNWVWDSAAAHHQLRADGSGYFNAEPRVNDDFPGSAITRLTPAGSKVPSAWECQWTLGQVVTAVSGAGLQIRRLDEHHEHFWDQFKAIGSQEMHRLPHTFSLLAEQVR